MLQTTNEGRNQRILKILGQCDKHFGLGCNYRPSSTGYFIITNQSFVYLAAPGVCFFQTVAPPVCLFSEIPETWMQRTNGQGQINKPGGCGQTPGLNKHTF